MDVSTLREIQAAYDRSEGLIVDSGISVGEELRDLIRSAQRPLPAGFPASVMDGNEVMAQLEQQGIRARSFTDWRVVCAELERRLGWCSKTKPQCWQAWRPACGLTRRDRQLGQRGLSMRVFYITKPSVISTLLSSGVRAEGGVKRSTSNTFRL